MDPENKQQYPEAFGGLHAVLKVSEYHPFRLVESAFSNTPNFNGLVPVRDSRAFRRPSPNPLNLEAPKR